ncbi:MAG: J domain-containing protein [Planctomycetes bacterium]|nr:J domain-containing protein [Planctomycetota bacterium]
MSEFHLPDDLTRWPRDPYEVLGVSPDLDAKEIRRAYVRLIRRFKPEQYPEQFRRVREAYEAASLYGQWLPRLGGDLGPIPAATPAGEEANPRAGEANIPVRSIGLDAVDLDKVWRQAINGNERAAYASLVAQLDSCGPNLEVTMRLYWLLFVRPELDDRRERCDWLVRGLLDHGMWTGCRELYRREIEERPEEGLSGRFRRLLEAMPSGRDVEDLLIWRWQAAGRLHDHHTIGSDMKALRTRMASADESWARALLVAADELAWMPAAAARALFDACCREIDGFSHLHTRLGEALTRLDQLRELSNSWQRNIQDHRVLRDLLQLVPMLWSRSPHEYRLSLLRYLGVAARDPRIFLQNLDLAQRDAAAELAIIGQGLSWIWSGVRSGEERSEDELACEIDLFLQQATPAEYFFGFRTDLLEFCTRAQIPPESVAAALDRKCTYNLTALPEDIRNDWPLRCTCMAYELVWG